MYIDLELQALLFADIVRHALMHFLQSCVCFLELLVFAGKLLVYLHLLRDVLRHELMPASLAADRKPDILKIIYATVRKAQLPVGQARHRLGRRVQRLGKLLHHLRIAAGELICQNTKLIIAQDYAPRGI